MQKRHEILDLSEKYGGSGQPRGLMEAFKTTLELCQLSDLGPMGQYLHGIIEDMGSSLRMRCWIELI